MDANTKYNGWLAPNGQSWEVWEAAQAAQTTPKAEWQDFPARNLQADYTSIEFDGVTYWVR